MEESVGMHMKDSQQPMHMKDSQLPVVKPMLLESQHDVPSFEPPNPLIRTP